jgi:two-component system, OmpR family, response regulator
MDKGRALPGDLTRYELRGAGLTTAGLCEDDHELREIVKRALSGEGFAVEVTATGSAAVTAFSERPPDVLVLDVGLPDADGRDVCAALRARGVTTPVLFLTARDALHDRLTGFSAGGDDYLTKPFALAELIARVHALVRRVPAGERTDGLVLDPAAHAIVHDGARIPLTPTEFRLLSALAAGAGAVVRRDRLVAAGWPHGAIVHDNTLDAYVAKLRRKLRDAGAPVGIGTARGVGYALE